MKKAVVKLYLRYILSAILTIWLQQFALGQIYCPSEEQFQGPVSEVVEKVYEIPVRHEGVFIIGGKMETDTLELSSQSRYTVQNGQITARQMKDLLGVQSCRCALSYNSDGQLLEKNTYRSNDTLDTRWVQLWNEGRIVESQLYDKSGNCYSRRVYKFDELKREEISREVFETHDEDIVIKTFNEANQIIRQYLVDSLGNKKLYMEKTYDSLGNNTETHLWNVSPRYDQHYINHFDSKNRVIRRDWFDRDGKAKGSDSLVYDTLSNLTYEHAYDFISGNWTTNCYSYEYDDYGNFVLKERWKVIMDEKTIQTRIVRKYTYLD